MIDSTCLKKCPNFETVTPPPWGCRLSIVRKSDSPTANPNPNPNSSPGS